MRYVDLMDLTATLSWALLIDALWLSFKVSNKVSFIEEEMIGYLVVV